MNYSEQLEQVTAERQDAATLIDDATQRLHAIETQLFTATPQERSQLLDELCSLRHGLENVPIKIGELARLQLIAQLHVWAAERAELLPRLAELETEYEPLDAALASQRRAQFNLTGQRQQLHPAHDLRYTQDVAEMNAERRQRIQAAAVAVASDTQSIAEQAHAVRQEYNRTRSQIRILDGKAKEYGTALTAPQSAWVKAATAHGRAVAAATRDQLGRQMPAMFGTLQTPV